MVGTAHYQYNAKDLIPAIEKTNNRVAAVVKGLVSRQPAFDRGREIDEAQAHTPTRPHATSGILRSTGVGCGHLPCNRHESD